MPKDGLSQLKKALKDGQPDRLYVFHGEEAYLRQFYTGRLRTLLVGENDGFNYEVFDARNLTIEKLQNAVDSLPFMAERRMVLVRDLDIYKPGEALKDALLKMLPDLPESVCLVFSYETIPFKADARTAMHKIVSSHVVEFAPQQTVDLIPWITRRFEACGKSVDHGLCDYMIFRFGHLMNGLIQEIEKIAAYARGDAITRRDIDEVGVPILEAAVYELTDALTAGQNERAIEKLLTFQAMREEPVILLAALGRALRGLLAAKMAQLNGQGVDQVMSA